jgi:hypothetical protein
MASLTLVFNKEIGVRYYKDQGVKDCCRVSSADGVDTEVPVLVELVLK